MTRPEGPTAPTLGKATFDGVPADTHGGVTRQRVMVGDITATRVAYEPGAAWSRDMARDMGSSSCPVPHVAVVVSGTLRVRMDDGAEEDFAAGEVMVLPAGHDAWPVTDEGAVFVEVSHGTEHLAGTDGSAGGPRVLA